MFIWILKIIAFLTIYPTSAMKHVVFGKVHGRVIRWNKILSPHKTQLGKIKLQIQNFYLLILTILLQLLSLIKKNDTITLYTLKETESMTIVLVAVELEWLNIIGRWSIDLFETYLLSSGQTGGQIDII